MSNAVLEIDINDFRLWVQRYKDGIAGHAGSDWACPIACYLRIRGKGEIVSVMSGEVTLDGQVFALPSWADYVAEQVDQIDRYNVYGQEVIEMLDYYESQLLLAAESGN